MDNRQDPNNKPTMASMQQDSRPVISMPKQESGPTMSVPRQEYNRQMSLNAIKQDPSPRLTFPPTTDSSPKVREFVIDSNGNGARILLDTETILKQCYHKVYSFNILCVGETGIGKSTLMDTLFNNNFQSVPSSHDLPNVKLKAHTYELQESNVRLKLTVVDTVGFGDQIDKTDSYKPIVDYIDDQFEKYLQEELKVKRSIHTYHDTRIHACLYFIAPTGHSLKSLDLVTMKALDSKVNIIPVIAKADTITKQELHKFKTKIMSELVSNGVQIYQFPTDDETVADLNSSMNGHLPFAVVGSLDEIKMGNKMVKARQYPWGTVQVENENHCDFVKLREMLIRTNMEDLRSTTHVKHYELYRRVKLQQMGFTDNESMSLQETYEQKRNLHQQELQKKEEEMRNMFVVRVKEKEQELKEAEKELQSKFETLKQQHSNEKKKVDDMKNRLESEMNNFNKVKAQAIAQAQMQTATIGKKKK